MTNLGFVCQSVEEKQTKLKAALRGLTHDMLSDWELNEVIESISVKRQYVVIMHTRIDRFRDSLTLSGMDRGRVVLGQARLGTNGHSGRLHFAGSPAVAIIRRQNLNLREMHIYVPRNRLGKEYA